MLRCQEVVLPCIDISNQKLPCPPPLGLIETDPETWIQLCNQTSD